MKKFVKLMWSSPLNNASRNKREMRLAIDNGYQVSVICGQLYEADRLDKELENIRIVSHARDMSYVPKSKIRHLLTKIGFRLSFYALLHEELRKNQPDVISCENVVNLRRACIFTLFMKNRPKLIYDSHEFEIGKRGDRRKLKLWFDILSEKYLMKRSAFTIVVNESIGQELVDYHALQHAPVVIRSTPPNWQLDKAQIEQTRMKICSQLGVSTNSFIVLYHGALMTQRGIETMIEALGVHKESVGVVLGSDLEGGGYLASLIRMAEDNGISDRLLFHPYVPITDLWRYVGAADVGIVMIENSCKSYYLSLPNKFLECIQSMTPIICSDFPEMSAIVNKYQIGLTCPPSDPKALAQCISTMQTDKAMYQNFKDNLKLAKSELSWEKERQKLQEAFDDYL